MLVFLIALLSLFAPAAFCQAPQERPVPRFFSGSNDPGRCSEGDFYYRSDTHTLNVCGDHNNVRASASDATSNSITEIPILTSTIYANQQYNDSPQVLTHNPSTGFPIYVLSPGGASDNAGIKLVQCGDLNCSASHQTVTDLSTGLTHPQSMDYASVKAAEPGYIEVGYVDYSGDATNNGYHFIRFKISDGTWTNHLITAISSYESAFYVDAADSYRVHFVYSLATTGAASIAYCADSACASITADNPVPILSVDYVAQDVIKGHNGFPLVLSHRQGTSIAEIAACSDLACSSGAAHVVATDQGYSGTIAIRSDGMPVIGYITSGTTKSLAVARCTAVDASACETRSIVAVVSTGATASQILLNASNVPSIASADYVSVAKAYTCADASCSGAATLLVTITSAASCYVGMDFTGTTPLVLATSCDPTLPATLWYGINAVESAAAAYRLVNTPGGCAGSQFAQGVSNDGTANCAPLPARTFSTLATPGEINPVYVGGSNTGTYTAVGGSGHMLFVLGIPGCCQVTSSVTFSDGTNTYVTDNFQPIGSFSGEAIGHAFNITGGPLTITCTLAPNPAGCGVVVAEFSGMGSTTDGFAFSPYVANGVGPEITTTTNDLLISALNSSECYSGDNTHVALSPGWTQARALDVSGCGGFIIQYQTQQVPGTYEAKNVSPGPYQGQPHMFMGAFVGTFLPIKVIRAGDRDKAIAISQANLGVTLPSLPDASFPNGFSTEIIFDSTGTVTFTGTLDGVSNPTFASAKGAGMKLISTGSTWISDRGVTTGYTGTKVVTTCGSVAGGTPTGCSNVTNTYVNGVLQ